MARPGCRSAPEDLGHPDLPVVGDPLYGIQGLELKRQFLHASRLSFPHPFGGKQVEVSSPLPDDLATALTRARG